MVAAVEVVVVEAVAVADKDRMMMRFFLTMLTPITRHLRASAVIFAMAACCISLSVNAQKIYESPEAAADALINAVKSQDYPASKIVLGENWKKFIPTQDPDDVEAFLAAWDKAHRIEMVAPGVAHIAVGESDWELPIPIVNTAKGWHFDVQAGADEMKTRRIGRNELATMQAALAYFDAQKDYARADRTGEGVLQYAQKFFSSPRQHDGLYWPADDGQEESPLGPLFGDSDKKSGEGYHGYRYKILTAQGRNAPGGAYSYLIKNRMISGFALIAWPMSYGESGVMSFMISHDGQLYQKDLGKNSAALAATMKEFDPDESWEKVDVSPISP